jgi:hypothetical protein
MVPAGDYLALKIANTSLVDESITTTGNSYLLSPETDPGFPVPEILTVALLGAGLAGLAVFIIIKRKQIKAKLLS